MYIHIYIYMFYNFLISVTVSYEFFNWRAMIFRFYFQTKRKQKRNGKVAFSFHPYFSATIIKYPLFKRKSYVGKQRWAQKRRFTIITVCSPMSGDKNSIISNLTDIKWVASSVVILILVTKVVAFLYDFVVKK